MSNFDIQICADKSVSMTLLTASDFNVCLTIYCRGIEENILKPNYKRNAFSLSEDMR